MGNWIKKHWDKTSLRILTVIGLIVIALTYAMSFMDGMTIEQDLRKFDLSKFGIKYSTYCINSLILYSYMKIRKLQQYKIQRKAKPLLRIDKIDEIALPNNSISESVEINIDGGYVRYDLFYEKYNRKIKQIAGLNVLICMLGIIPYIYYSARIADCIILVVQILVGLFNIMYLVLGELEHSEIKFSSIKLSHNIKDCEKKINEKYEEFMTFHIQRECIVMCGKQPYYVIQYSKLKNKYRVFFNFVCVIGIIFVLEFTIDNNLWSVLTAKNGLFLIIFPNILLIAFCMVSNMTYYNKILQHKVVIEEYTKEKITEYKEREIKKLTYQTNITMGKKKIKRLWIISIMDLAEQKSIAEVLKKHISNKYVRDK